ncbi:type IV toxin-antitoxin system AbiEi family antitoxin [Cnuibacter sp. UC19_7]|uniref:type IV toxin-antitoxin system AbiEi family antitoxin n=1 Tax=Cnuibacter sp. UC19_7 TaxID=3350166 RepID=UPI00367274B4
MITLPAPDREFSHEPVNRRYLRENRLFSDYDHIMAGRENTESLSTLLRALPPELGPERDGDVVRVWWDREAWALRPFWSGEGLPADAKRMTDRIAHEIGDSRTIPVVTARRVSPGAREILDSADLSWADMSGRAHIVVPGRLYIARLEPARAETRRTFAWSPSADAIAETLLSWRAHQQAGAEAPIAKGATIAESAGVSPAQAARVLRQFDERGYTVKTGPERGSAATRRFVDPGRMLSDWAGHYAVSSNPRPDMEFHVPWREPTESMSVLHKALAGIEWALTGEAAADRIAPYPTSVSAVDLYVHRDDLSIVSDLLTDGSDVTRVDAGGRIRMRAAADHVFRLAAESGGEPAVSPVRVYVDLLRGRGRSAEAGEHLREVAIGF